MDLTQRRWYAIIRGEEVIRPNGDYHHPTRLPNQSRPGEQGVDSNYYPDPRHHEALAENCLVVVDW
jgi:hypothetical protein